MGVAGGVAVGVAVGVAMGAVSSHSLDRIIDNLTVGNSAYSRAAKEPDLVYSKAQKLLKCLEFCSLGVCRLP